MKKKICFLEGSFKGPTDYHKSLFNNELCDFYFITYGEKNNDDNCLGFFPKSQWANTRNQLYKLVPKNYEYYCIIDHDIIFKSQISNNPIEQIIEDLNKCNPAVMYYYYEYIDKTLKNLEKGVYKCKLFGNNCVKIIHHSLLDWFFPLHIKYGSYGPAHLFNILEIPFKDYIIESHTMIMINPDHSAPHNRNKSEAPLREKVWKDIKPYLKKINNKWNHSFDIKTHYIKQEKYYYPNNSKDKIDDFMKLIDVDEYINRNWVYFSERKKYI